MTPLHFSGGHRLAVARFRGRTVQRTERYRHSALMPANLITFAHFSVSSTTSLVKSAGEPGSTVAPSSAALAWSFGSASAALISRLRVSTMAPGVFLGAP